MSAPSATADDRARVDKVVRLVGTSTDSWEAAARSAVREAGKTIRELSTARVADLDIDVRDGAPVFRVLLELAFRVDRARVTPSGPVDVRRYLVVADTTLHSGELREVVVERLARGPAEFHVVVPRSADASVAALVLADPISGYMVPALPTAEEDAAEARAAALARLDAFVALLTPHAPVTGEIGPANPVRAVEQVLHRASFDEVILSTLPSTLSRWLHRDLPSRLRRATSLPVTHVEAAATEPARGGAR